MAVPFKITEMGRSLTEATSTITGDTPTRAVFEGDDEGRDGVFVHNPEDIDLWINLVNAGDAAEIEEADKLIVLSAGDSDIYMVSPDIDLIVMNASGDATETSWVAKEIRVKV